MTYQRKDPALVRAARQAAAAKSAEARRAKNKIPKGGEERRNVAILKHQHEMLAALAQEDGVSMTTEIGRIIEAERDLRRNLKSTGIK